MRVQFGWHLDGSCWPETFDGRHASLGTAVAGPAGLLTILETRLGLSGPDAWPALRTAQYLARLRQADDGARFYSRSLAADGWSVAGRLLAWRDALVEAGWNGSGGGSRLDTLAAVERAPVPLAPGRADRLRAVLDALAGPCAAPIAELRLATPAALLRPPWRALLDRLGACGTRIVPGKEPAPAADGDLGAVGRWLTTGVRAACRGDGTLTVLEADEEWLAAEMTAGWLAAAPDDNHGMVILRGQRTTLLDEACRRLGLPRVGGAGRSPWRAAVQVLPLAFATLWNPLDVRRLMELLTLPQSPIPASVADLFADALTQAPGVGGPPWQEAWRSARERRRTRLEERGVAGPDLETRLDAEEREWRGWLETPRFDEDDGIPVGTAVALCGRVAGWARSRAGAGAGPGDDLLRHVAAQADAMAAVVGAAGLGRLPKPQLDRMLDSVIGEGAALPAGGAEAAPWTVVDEPGQVWGAARTVLWWGFLDPGRGREPSPWSNAERAALAAAGCLPETPEAALRRDAWAWRLPVLNAAERLILVKPRSVAGEPGVAHPLWHEIQPVLGPALDGCRIVHASAGLWRDRVAFAGRPVARTALEPCDRPAPRRLWRVPVGAVPMRDRESATSLERLLGCPFAWVLRHAAGVRPGALRAIPDGSRLLGTLAHAVVAELFAERPSWPPDEAALRAAALFDRLLPVLAAPLQRPGFGLERERARAMVAEAVRSLARLMEAAGLTVRACEEPVEEALPEGVTLEGIIDLLLEEAATGRPVVLDLKWSGSDRHRRREVAEGRAIQLAVYGRLVGQGAVVPAGYYMLAQQRLLACAPEPFPAHAHVPGSDLPAVWRAAWESRATRLAGLRRGEILAPGVPAEDDGEAAAPALTLSPPCGLCEYGRLCGAGSLGA
ncbi:RecB family exonuclease [Azospirillum sp. sgz301742]